MRKIIFFIIWISMFLGCMLTYSCGPSKLQKAKETLSENTKEAAKFCSEKFPVVGKIEYKPGKTDTVTQTKTETKFIEVDCPPGEVPTKVKQKVEIQYKEKIIHKVDTVLETKPDKARETYLEGEISDLKAERDKYRAEAEKWQARAKKRARNEIYLIIALAAAVGWITRKFWMPVISKLT